MNQIEMLESTIDTMYTEQADRLLASGENVSTFLRRPQESLVIAHIDYMLAEITYLTTKTI